ncbi:formimidoylglutamate deiminase [Rhizobium panacihumi]|uniref:formimidoylglutamate deiminase n=1 Tax=Rhizobium panacihumi TaxID=2008450 RepID=UPI003D7BA98B
MAIFAQSALLAGGWAENVRLTMNDGRIALIETGVEPQPDDERHAVLLPAMPNLHSHAFQRGMAGLAEVRGPSRDSFWSWRTVMYKFALSMTPEHVEAVAAQLYMEMLEAGFGRVGEFHYLHHDRNGTPYADPAEMAARIAAASERTGLSLTLLPVFYAHSGFGAAAASDGQRRFIHSLDAFEKLMMACADLVGDLDGGVLGVAPHSLRAVTPDELAAVTAMVEGRPVHIHIAEQLKEVKDCIAWSGARPVEWLLDHAPVDENWCLIHATHMTDAETRAMAKRKAMAGLCPITEANLGDGIFCAPAFLEEGGQFGIGSDSNILISLVEELRTFEYSQRLAQHARNVVATSGGSTGRRLFDGALSGGAQALGVAAGLVEGHPADLVSLKVDAVPYLGQDRILDQWLFAGGVSVDCVWTRGVRQVSGGRHKHRDEINRRFQMTMKELLAE